MTLTADRDAYELWCPFTPAEMVARYEALGVTPERRYWGAALVDGTVHVTEWQSRRWPMACCCGLSIMLIGRTSDHYDFDFDPDYDDVTDDEGMFWPPHFLAGTYFPDLDTVKFTQGFANDWSGSHHPGSDVESWSFHLGLECWQAVAHLTGERSQQPQGWTL